jgi:hypothetical protein
MSEKGPVHDLFQGRQLGRVGERPALTGSQLRAAERRLVERLEGKGFPSSWIERNLLELLAGASEEYARWLDEHEPDESPAGWLSARAYRSALNLPAEDGDEGHIPSSQEPRELPARPSRGGPRPVLPRWFITGLAATVCGLAVSVALSLPRHDGSPRTRFREQTHALAHRRSPETVAIGPSIPLGRGGPHRPTHHRLAKAKMISEPAKAKIETDEGSAGSHDGGWGSEPDSPPAQEATPSPPPVSPAGAQVREEFGL